MALIKCPECGKEVSDKSDKCVNCGYPLSEKTISYKDAKEHDVKVNKKNKGDFSTARIVIGIFMLVLSVMVLFQSCAAGMVNVAEGNKDAFDGMIGFCVSLCMIAFGIISIATRRTRSYISLRVVATISAIIFILVSFVYNGIYSDLKIWGFLFGVYSVIFSLSSNAIQKNNS